MDAVQELRNPKFRGVKSIANWDCIFRILSRPIATKRSTSAQSLEHPKVSTKRLTRPTFSISCTLTFPEAFFFRRTNILQTYRNPKKIDCQPSQNALMTQYQPTKCFIVNKTQPKITPKNQGWVTQISPKQEVKPLKISSEF